MQRSAPPPPPDNTPPSTRRQREGRWRWKDEPALEEAEEMEEQRVPRGTARLSPFLFFLLAE